MSLRTGALGAAFAFIACNPAQGDISSDDTMPGINGATPFPCEVGAALQSKCWGCHGDVTNYGAPMSLTTWESVHQPTKDGTQEIFQRIKARIHDSAAPMPPRLYPQLSEQEKATLDAWIDAGAPSGNGCAPPPTGTGGTVSAGTGGGGTTNTGGTGGMTYYGGTGGGGSGGTSGGGGSGGSVIVGPPPTPDAGAPEWSTEDIPVEPTPDECDYLTFHARQDASGAEFNVPGNYEQYFCFGFQIPLEAGAQSLAFYPEIDNTNVIHHWLLYKTGPQFDGTNNICLGFHPDGELIAGWAPGAGAVFFPEHVGQELGAGGFILEVHYNNTGPATTDGSGVKVCKAKVHRPQTASVSWLGTEAINIPASSPAQATSTCAPNITEPIHVLRAWPHMHRLGKHMTTTINRAGGGSEPLVDVDFDFNYQWQYDTPAILNTGDTLKTTCFYENDTASPIGFGEATSSEMCYNFITAYPARALLGGGLHSTSCNSGP